MDGEPVSYYSFKILLLGGNSVGKTSLLTRFTQDTFTTNTPTVGVETRPHKLIIDGQLVKLLIWDTSGQERYKIVIGPYHKGADAILLVYNVCDRQSFEEIQDWLGEIKGYAHKGVKKLLIGNKCDEKKERTVSYEEGKKYADMLGIKFIETSAKDTGNVESAFTMTIEELMRNTEKVPLTKLRMKGPAKNKCY